jgi:hypothetical protein
MAKKPLAPLATRVKTDPKLRARALKDPGLRSKLPDKYLTPQQLQSRRHNQYLADLGDIGSPLSGQSLVNTARQTVDSDFAPLLAGIGNQEQIVNKSAGIQGDWAKRYYGDLNGLLSAIGGQQGAANAAAVQGAVDRGAATQGAITAADTGAQQRLASDATVRGAGLQGSAPADLAASTAAQQQLAATEAQRNQQSAQSFGDAQAAFLRGLQGAAAQQGGEYQQQISGAQAQALNKLAQDRSDLRTRQQGQFTDTLLKMRQNEAQNAITQAGLGIDQQRAELNAASDAASLAQRQREFEQRDATARRGQTLSHQDRVASIKARGKGKGQKGSGSGGATDAAVGAAQDGTSSALADAKKLFGVGIRDRHQLATYLLQGKKGTTQDVLDPKTGKPVLVTDPKTHITTKKTVSTGSVDKHDPLWTSIALDVLIDNHVSRENARKLHARGLTVEDLGYPSYTAWKKKGGKSKTAATLSPSERAPGGT